MPDQERDAAADKAFEAWLDGTFYGRQHPAAWDDWRFIWNAAWHAALAHVEKERQTAMRVRDAAVAIILGATGPAAWSAYEQALDAYDAARANTGGRR